MPLGASWARLGAFWGHLGGVLGRLGGVLGVPWGVLGAAWGLLVASWGVFGSQKKTTRLGPYFRIDFCSIFVPTWTPENQKNIDFSLVFQYSCGLAQYAAKTHPRRPQDAPRHPQDAPKTPPRRPQDVPRRPRIRKIRPTWSHVGMNNLKRTALPVPCRVRFMLEGFRAQDASKTPQDAPKTPLGLPKIKESY